MRTVILNEVQADGRHLANFGDEHQQGPDHLLQFLEDSHHSENPHVYDILVRIAVQDVRRAHEEHGIVKALLYLGDCRLVNLGGRKPCKLGDAQRKSLLGQKDE